MTRYFTGCARLERNGTKPRAVQQQEVSLAFAVADKAGGQLETLQLLIGKHCPCSFEAVCCISAKRGHLHILQWLTDSGYKLHMLTCYYAAKGMGHTTSFSYV